MGFDLELKTREQWFDGLPEKYHLKAYANYERERGRNAALGLGNLFETLPLCLESSFAFYDTPEGKDFWKEAIEEK